MGTDIFFDGFAPLQRILVVGCAAYVALILVLRLSGKRTLSKFNAFDFVVTIAIGSTFASILTSRTLSLAEGLTALTLLVAMQFLVTFLSARLPTFDRLVKSEPTLLLRGGEMLPEAMRRQRVTSDELLAAIRQSGGEGLADAAFVLLESDGSLVAVLRR